MDQTQIWDLLLRGVAIGALAAMAAGLARGAAGASQRVAGVLFCLGAAAYALNSSDVLRQAVGPWFLVLVLFASSGVGLFWLFLLTLFEDRPITPAMLIPAAVLAVIAYMALASPPATRAWLFGLHHVIQAGLVLHALVVIARGWRGDLVEVRRRMRGGFMTVVALYSLVITGAESTDSSGHAPVWFDLASAFILAALSVSAAFIFLQARAALFGVSPQAAATTPALDAGDRLLLDQLNQIMDSGEAWRREGLTIGALADELKIPEHRLRRLINDQLGARNFAAFVNGRRVGAAKLILSNPSKARTPVSAIAFDLGFASLGPFNRAFKEETGLTPSEWRRRELGEASPNLENPS
jgi:AraC-like DNA-binding protein